MANSLSAKQKLMSHLSRKSYSRQELVQKLERHFSAEEIREACDWATELNLIESPSAMAERYSQELIRKGKGPKYIEAALRKKGLPVVTSDRENDLESAKHALQKKFKFEGQVPANLARKAVQFLAQRGFNHETIRKALGKIDYEIHDPAADS